MAKQAKTVNYAKAFQDVDSELSAILDKCNNGKSVDGLNPNVREKLWFTLFNLIKKHNVRDISENSIEILKNCINLIITILSGNNLNALNEMILVEIVKYLNGEELSTEESSIINTISKLNEYWLVKVQSEGEIPGMEYFTLKHLLDLCTCDKPLVSDIQRLGAIRKSVTTAPFDKAVPSLRPLLIKLVQKIPVLTSEHGQRFIAQALILSQKIMTEIHKTILLDLGSCTKKKAGDYGKIYVMAWHCASQEMKPSLEKICFQHLMETFLKEPRTSLELNKNSQNILAVLEVWHSERKKKHPGFITMLTNAYQPILWKYLQSGFNVHRCNATDLFFKAFPLQRCDDSASEAEKFFNMQYDTMLTSLKDDCHIVRIIAIREVCNILSHYWNSFTPFQIQNLMSVITKENATDASTAEVRRMVYVGLQSLVKSPLSCEYMKQILPNLANNIHDVNQRVRTVFIQLLICIKEKKDPTFKYSDVVPMFDIQYRLAEDNIAVGQWIVKLLMRNYYHSKMSVVEWTKRFIYLIKTYTHSYRNFFFYSSKSLPFTDACNIIYEILSQLGMFVMSRSCDDEENNENIVEKVGPKEKKKGGKKAPLSDWNGSKQSSEMESSSSKKCAFDDPEVISGLFDIVTILWVLHDSELNKPENEEVRLKLYDTYIKYAQPFINYYKDCDLFVGIISLSGNIPASLLRNNSITLPGYCIKMLKSIKIDRSDEENDKIISMLTALAKWGRGSEILEQVTLWLDAAFETQNMNETILPRRRVKISETIQPNSVVAIYILDILLKQEYIKLSILRKNYHELFHLWKFMSRIRQLIETRLDQGEPFEEELVSDEFLKLCFRRYVKLIPLLKEDEGVDENKENNSQNQSETKEDYVNRQKEIENVIEWGENSLFLLLQQENLNEEDVDLITTVLEDILYVADNMIIVHMVNSLFYFKTSHFVLKLLNTKYGARFIKAASRITAALNFCAKQLFKVKDDLQIFSTVIPSILSHSLNVLTNSKLTLKEIEKLEKDFPAIKVNYSKVLAAFQDNLKLPSSLKENVRQLKLVVGFFVDAIVSIISNDIPRKDSVIPVYSVPAQLPGIAGSLMSLFYNRKTWAPLFLHVINTKLSVKSYDLKGTISCILLLQMCVSDKKGDREALKKALSSALTCLTKLKELNGKTGKAVEDSMDTETTTTKKTWPSNAATKGQSSTWTGLMLKSTDDQEDTSKEVIPPSEGTNGDDNRMIVDESEDVSACQGKEDSLEEDLLNCGFELIKNIENSMENRTEEADDSS